MPFPSPSQTFLAPGEGGLCREHIWKAGFGGVHLGIMMARAGACGGASRELMHFNSVLIAGVMAAVTLLVKGLPF